MDQFTFEMIKLRRWKVVAWFDFHYLGVSFAYPRFSVSGPNTAIVSALFQVLGPRNNS